MRILESISEKRSISYTVGVLLGVIVWASYFIISGSTQIWELTNIELLIGITGILSKFLSGFGIMLTYAAFGAIVFRIMSPFLRGSKIRLKIIKSLLIIPILLIMVYAVYVIWKTLATSGGLSELELITATYGIWSLMFAVYILPAIKNQFQPEFQKDTLDKVRETIGEGRHKIWRGYQYYLRRDYGTVYSNEFERYKAQLNDLRMTLGALLLLPIAVVMAIIPPLAGATIILWLRLLSTNYKPLSRWERSFLILIALAVLLFVTFLFLTPTIVLPIVYLNYSYAIGIFLSIIVLSHVIIRS